jgi:hypothetical protein
MALKKMYQMRGAKSPIADLQYGGVYQGNNGRYFKRYPAISKFASPNFSGDPKRTQRGRVNMRGHLTPGSRLLDSGGRNANVRTLYGLSDSPVRKSGRQLRNEEARCRNMRTLNFSA